LHPQRSKPGPEGQGAECATDYRELHRRHQRDNGRLYYGRTRTGKYRVLVAVKLSEQTQQRDLEKLRLAAGLIVRRLPAGPRLSFHGIGSMARWSGRTAAANA
jgi:hypothetical protein